MGYFEYDLPAAAPDYIHESRKAEFEQILNTVKARMDKLEEALEISGLTGATFAEYAKLLFDALPKRFEAMAPDELAEYVLTVHDGQHEAKERLEWPNAVTVVDTAFLTVPEWEAIRRLGIGGSEAACTTGAKSYTTPYELYHDKRWVPRYADKQEENKVVFDRGHMMEPRVIEAFCETVGAEVVPETRMFRSKAHPCCVANIDAIVQFPNGGLYVFEAKTTIAENFGAWIGDQIPAPYVPQMVQYPAVLDDDRIKGAYIGCLFTVDHTIHGMYIGSDTDVGQFVSRYIERDKGMEDRQLTAEEDFFERHIVGGEVPELSGAFEEDTAIVAAFTGPADRNAEVLELDGSFEDALEIYMDLKEQKNAVDRKSNAIKEAMDGQSMLLILALGTSIEGRLPVSHSEDGEYYEVKYSPRSKTIVDKEKLKIKYPEAYAECVSTDPDSFRVFSVKMKRPKK